MFESNVDSKRWGGHHDLNAEDSEEAGSSLMSFIRYLTCNLNIQKGGMFSPFVVIQDLVHIIISEWTTVYTYVARELGTIDYRLENERGQSPKVLEEFLNTLFILRRRDALYESLIRE